MDRRAKMGLSILTVFAALVLLAVTTRTYAPKAGEIVSTGTPLAARFSHTATLLANNKVLIAGGMERNGVWLDSAEIYDPVTERFTPAGRMMTRRAGAMAVRLPNGKVLIAGGTDGSGKSLASTELFDPAKNSFTPGDNMNFPRAHGVAVLLKDDKVLITGGCAEGDEHRLASAEIYKPVTRKFTLTGSMHIPRGAFNAVVLLKSGRVLVTGGMSSGELPNVMTESSGELYDPVEGHFDPTGSMLMPRYKHGMVLLPDGKVLVVGGQKDGALGERLASTEIYDPATGRFSRGPDMRHTRFKLMQGVVALKDGHVLVSGGADQSELYDPGTNSFVAVPGPAVQGYYFSSATVLNDGRVLLVDGYGRHAAAGAVRQAWLWQP